MKLTDFALIFVAVFLPILVLVYVNTSFVVKAEKQEMYYKNIMNSAVSDAVSSMKHVENEDQDIDYGYSGIVDNKVSVNADVAVSTLYNSLANNFNINGNEISVEKLKMYIPVIAVLDYDGIYIHSAEKEESGDISFVTKPKVYYTYTYVLVKDVEGLGGENNYQLVSLDVLDELNSIKDNLLSNYIYEITFTMDDYVYLKVYEIDTTNSNRIKKTVVSNKFYMTDEQNNKNLIYGASMLNIDKINLKKQIIDKLSEVRRTVIATIGMREISYAVNKHNTYAKSAGINYTFNFSVESDAVWHETVDGIGMIAIIQGISLGNRYLNYKAYSASDLIIAKKYYVSKGVTMTNKELSYFEKNLYHESDKCVVYAEYINTTGKTLIPEYYNKRSEAATQGFSPCPICKP